jgi:hypothetical protein
MRVRSVIILTGIVSSILGALVVYLVLSVPNDLRADALLKQARQDIEEGRREDARVTLLKVVQQYPRTDGAAAATAALVSLAQKDRDDLARAIALMGSQNVDQSKLIEELQKSVADLKAPAPAVAPKVVTVQAPPPPAAVKPAPPKKKTATKKTTRRRR